eukprot:jgi/Chrzof1/322/Cz01g11110.t1
MESTGTPAVSSDDQRQQMSSQAQGSQPGQMTGEPTSGPKLASNLPESFDLETYAEIEGVPETTVCYPPDASVCVTGPGVPMSEAGNRPPEVDKILPPNRGYSEDPELDA